MNDKIKAAMSKIGTILIVKRYAPTYKKPMNACPILPACTPASTDT